MSAYECREKPHGRQPCATLPGGGVGGAKSRGIISCVHSAAAVK